MPHPRLPNQIEDATPPLESNSLEDNNDSTEDIIEGDNAVEGAVRPVHALAVRGALVHAHKEVAVVGQTPLTTVLADEMARERAHQDVTVDT